MLTKNKNSKASYIGRVLVLPLAVLLFAAFTLKTKNIKNTTFYAGKKITVVLDAGHGGKDFGAVSLDRSISEKDLSLAIVKKIKFLNNNSNINLILTRDNDIYQTPREKADLSNEKNADLLVSIHIDGITKDSAAIKSGMSVIVAKNNFTNADNSKLFASAIISEFANDYKIPVAMLPQQRQKGIWLIQASNCPAVLIEAGYITNKKDLAYMQSEEGQETIAKNVLAAIGKYALAQNTTVKANADNLVTLDTIPKNISANSESKSNDSLNDALYVLNGKIIGTWQTVEKTLKGQPDSMNVNMVLSLTVLNKTDAIAKYGKLGKNGAVEIISTSNKNQQKNNQATDNISPQTSSTKDDKVFTQVENEPKFPGGDSAWHKFLEKNLNPSTPIDNGAPTGTYRVVVRFIVSKDGSISDVQAETKHGYGMEAEVVKLIKKGPRWEPAIQNGNIVAAYKKQPITFVVSK